MPERPGRHAILRFLLLGVANTGATYALLLVLTSFLPLAWAYSVAFAVGLAVNVLATGHVVFASTPAWSRRAAYGGWLGVVYLCGLAVSHVAVDVGVHAHAELAALPLLVTAPLSFLGGRMLLAGPVATPVEDGWTPEKEGSLHG